MFLLSWVYVDKDCCRLFKYCIKGDDKSKNIGKYCSMIVYVFMTCFDDDERKRSADLGRWFGVQIAENFRSSGVGYSDT